MKRSDHESSFPGIRASLLIFGLFLCTAFSGCSRTEDFSAFLVKEVTGYGGRGVSNAPLPVLLAHWTVNRDANGFQASVKGVSFSSIASVMLQKYGPPKIATAINLKGHPQQVWAAAAIGVAIQLIGRPYETDIICVRSDLDMRKVFRRMGPPDSAQ